MEKMFRMADGDPYLKWGSDLSVWILSRDLYTYLGNIKQKPN